MAGANWADGTVSWADNSYTWASDTGTELTTPVDLTPIVEWSPTTNPGDSPVWVDITEYVRGGSIDRGRQSEFDRTSAGKLKLQLLNIDRTFDPEYNSNARPNKRIRVSCSDGAVVGNLIRLFDGWIDALPQSYVPPNLATVDLEATDGFKLLGRHVIDPIYASVVEDDSPWGWWRLADDLPRTTVVADASGHGFHGVWKGTPTSTQSLVADGLGAVSLDGSGDNIEGSADGAVMDVSTGVTLAAAPVSIEAWVKTGKYGTNHSFICGQTHTVGTTAAVIDFGLTMNNSTGVPSFIATVGGINVSCTGTTVLRDTGVHHLVGTVDSSRVGRLYVDGVLQATHNPGASTAVINASGSVRIGKPPLGADPGAGWSYKAWKGDVCEVAVYNTALSASRVLAHYQAGYAPWSGDTTGGRVTRILDLIGWSSERYIETGISTLGPAPDGTGGGTALDHLQAVEQTEQGRFFISAGGYAAFYSRHHGTTLTAEATFTDAQVNDIEFAYDETNLCNDMTATRVGGVPQRAQSATSIAAYWRISDQMSGLLYSTDNEAKNFAEWRVGNYATPTIRPTGLTFKPMRDLPNQYHAVLDRELGDRISVTRSVPGTDITVDAVIEGISHRFSVDGTWVTSWNLSPLTFGVFGPGGGNGFSYWKLDDPVLSKLDSGNRLGF